MVIHPYYQGPFYARLDHGLLARYILTGAVTTLADYLTFTVFFSYAGAGLLAATVIAYIVGLVVSYLLSRYLVFSKGANRQSATTSLVRYAAFLAINLALTYAILWALEQWLGITPYIGKFIVGAFMFFWIYAGNTYWVFRGEKTGPIQL